MYIKQKTDGVVTVLNIDNYKGELPEHPTLLSHPELFELIDEVMPKDVQFINFQLPE